jgi:glycine/D-amino acid oxidase-like deaminating enzyme
VKLALDAGAELHGATRALSLVRRGSSGWRVATNRGDVDAGDVLVATNAYRDGLVPWLERRVLPIGSFVIATEVLDPEVARAISPRGRMFFDTKNFLFYWRLSPDGRVVFGGRTSLGATTVPIARDVLYRELVRVHPQLTGARVERAWGGSVAITLDRLPHCGRVDGVAFATGCNGTGIALATWFGARAAAWMSREEPAPAFAQLQFPAIPLHQFRERYLPAVGWWLRARDLVGR